MTTVTVVRHGDRWAVRDPSSSSPLSEHLTREEAELEARRRAGDGGRVEVIEDDPTGLAAVDHDEHAPRREGVHAPDLPQAEVERQQQAGL